MIHFKNYINEWKLDSDVMSNTKDFITPESIDELKSIIKQRYKEYPKHLDLRDVNVIKITSFGEKYEPIFENCNETEVIDIRGWITMNVKDFSFLFAGCLKLKQILGINDIDVSNGTEFWSMFQYCQSLETIDISKWKLTTVDKVSYMFWQCDSLREIKGLENFKEHVEHIEYKGNRDKFLPYSNKFKIPDWYDKLDN